jgi:pimeloyl-ACP methyl ester carboxylesterase
MPPLTNRLTSTFAATVIVGTSAALLAACTGSGGHAATPSASGEPSVAIAAGHLPLACLPEGASAATIGPDATSTVVAWAGSGPDGVVLAPQVGQDACQWAEEWTRLTAQGYAVASFEWSQDGVQDVRRAANKLRELGVQKVALVGTSKGASGATALAHELDARALVSISAGPTFEGRDTFAAAKTFTGPMLVIASEEDGGAPVSARKIARDPATLLIVDGGAHGKDLFDGPHADAVRAGIDATLTAGFAG